MDPWSVFDDDDTPTTTTNTTTSTNTATTTTATTAPEVSTPAPSKSSYGTKFISTHKEELMNFINEGLNQTIKDLTEIKQAHLGGLLKTAFIAFKRGEWDLCETSATKVEQTCWTALEGHKWDHVAWRETYIFSQLMLITVDVARPSSDQSNLKKAIRRADVAVIMGAPAQLVSPLADTIEKQMDLSKINNTKNLPPVASFRFTKQSLPNLPKISSAHQIKIEENLTIEDFKQKYFQPGVPAIIRGQMKNWPGIEKWTNMEYLMSQYGHRTVPIELGKHDYKSNGKWKEELITIGEFITKYIVPSCTSSLKGETMSNDKVAYLAQHHLFDQLQTLSGDIEVPPYAAACGELANINAWFGTASTTTPLHYDSYHNCLAQVFGFKYVRLYMQSETPKLYVHELSEENKKSAEEASTLAQGNISKVNVEDYDKSEFPLFEGAEYTETILGPGDILFLPANVWHYVRSCSPSFSVSFWFE